MRGALASTILGALAGCAGATTVSANGFTLSMSASIAQCGSASISLSMDRADLTFPVSLFAIANDANLLPNQGQWPPDHVHGAADVVMRSGSASWTVDARAGSVFQFALLPAPGQGDGVWLAAQWCVYSLLIGRRAGARGAIALRSLRQAQLTPQDRRPRLRRLLAIHAPHDRLRRSAGPESIAADSAA